MLYVRNLPFNILRNEMYDIFGKYGAIRQIRIETNKDTKGTTFFIYEDIYDAKTAVDHLSGFNVANRYLTVLYYQQAKMGKKSDTKKKEEEIAKMQEKYGVSTKDKFKGVSSFVILRAVARFLENNGFSKTLKKFISEAGIEKDELKDLPLDLKEMYCKYFEMWC
ncbi:hypothetical protein ACFX2C_011187 [Malus domestica]